MFIYILDLSLRGKKMSRCKRILSRLVSEKEREILWEKRDFAAPGRNLV